MCMARAWHVQVLFAEGDIALGLRRKMSSRGLSLVHRQPIGKVPGGGSCHVGAGVTLTVPNELRLALGSGGSGSLQELAETARMEIDAVRLEVCFDGH